MLQNSLVNEAKDLKALQDLLADESELEQLDTLLNQVSVSGPVGRVQQRTRYSNLPPQVSPEQDAEDRQSLQQLLAEETKLQKLDGLLSQFNVFEAVGLVRREIYHSHFLAFLLDPHEPHGLGDAFLKGFIQKALAQDSENKAPVLESELNEWDLTVTVVQREWRQIDILARNEANRLVMLIENKIDSGEHSDQLARYLEIVNVEYSDWKVIPIFLTPEGDEASDIRYLAVSYGMVVEAIESISEDRSTQLAPDVLMLMNHYTQMLRRHIVSGSEIDILCQQIYQKHKRALDLIFERRPDRQTEIRNFMRDLVESEPDFMLDRADQNSKAYVHFLVRGWDVPALSGDEGWTRSRRMLLFSFANHEDRIRLQLEVGPGEDAIRQRLATMTRSHRSFFLELRGARVSRIYNKTIVSREEIDTMDLEEIQEKIKTFWDQFVNGDLVTIRKAVQEAIPGVDVDNQPVDRDTL